MHVFAVCVCGFFLLSIHMFFLMLRWKRRLFRRCFEFNRLLYDVNVVSWPRLYLLNDIILSRWNDFNLSTTNKPHFRGWYLLPFVFYSFFHIFLEIRHMPFPNFHVYQIFLWNINAWLFFSYPNKPVFSPSSEGFLCHFLLYSSLLFLPKIPWIMYLYVDFVSFEIE